MIELLIALVVVIGAFGLIWWAICLIRPPLLGGLAVHALLCIAISCSPTSCRRFICPTRFRERRRRVWS
jgi:hypothetical protein